MIKLNIFSKPFKAILDKFQPSRHLAAQIEARNSKFETLTDKDENFFEKVESPDRDCSRFQPLMT